MTTSTTQSTLTVTVTSAVTIIDADTTYFRYDNPSPSELVRYCLTLIDDEPAGYTIAVDATEEVGADFAEELVSASEKGGFSAYICARDHDTPALPRADLDLVPASGPVAEVQVPGETPQEITGLIRPVDGRESSSRARLPVIVLGATVAVVLGAGIWAVGMSTRGPAPAIDGEVQPGASDADEAAQQASSVVSPAPVPTAPLAHAAPETVVLAQDGLEVTLPAGFHLEADDDMWKAEGDDPDFRLQLAIDDLYGLPSEQLLKQVEREISDDPELELVAVDDMHIEYRQVAIDGSEATWVTWAEADVQLSVGCHSRTSPTTVQRATCQMAYESARYTTPAERL